MFKKDERSSLFGRFNMFSRMFNIRRLSNVRLGHCIIELFMTVINFLVYHASVSIIQSPFIDFKKHASLLNYRINHGNN